MRKFSISCLFCFSMILSQAQFNSQLDSLNKKRNTITKTGMLTLSGWSVLNIGTGFSLAGGSHGQDKYFHRMNAYFGLVNLAISQMGYWRTRKMETKAYGLTESLRQQKQIELTFIANAGLDVAYIAAGLYLRERANRKLGEKRDQLKGYGTSVILQGGGLMLFDVIMYTLQSKHGKGYNKILQKLELGVAPNEVGISLNF